MSLGIQLKSLEAIWKNFSKNKHRTEKNGSYQHGSCSGVCEIDRFHPTWSFAIFLDRIVVWKFHEYFWKVWLTTHLLICYLDGIWQKEKILDGTEKKFAKYLPTIEMIIFFSWLQHFWTFLDKKTICVQCFPNYASCLSAFFTLAWTYVRPSSYTPFPCFFVIKKFC